MGGGREEAYTQDTHRIHTRYTHTHTRTPWHGPEEAGCVFDGNVEAVEDDLQHDKRR